MIGKFEGQDLTHPWAGNVIDLCPVGALLSKDSLNKARAWELDRTASVCPNCSQGCNMIVETRDNMVVRLRPRPNDDVNKYFMCDHGRLNYRWMNRQDRVDVADGAAGRRRSRRPTGRSRSRAAAHAARGQAGVRARVAECCRTRRCSCSRELVKKTGGAGAFRVDAGRRSAAARRRGSRAARGSRGERARRRAARLHAQRAPLVGARRGRRARSSPTRSWRGIDAADVAKAGAVIVIGTTLPAWARHAATVVLPIANFAEEEGTFTNLRGRVQRFLQAKAAPGFARPSWYVLSAICSPRSGAGTSYSLASEVFDALAAARPAFAGHDLRHARPAGAADDAGARGTGATRMTIAARAAARPRRSTA